MGMTNRWFHFCLAAWVAATLLILPCQANTSVRNWKLLTGETFSAELVSYNETTGVVHLRIDEKVDRDFSSKSLSLPDQAWLVEWKDLDDEMQALQKKLGGSLSLQRSEDPQRTEFWVYRPSKSTPEEKLPLFILFTPNGNAQSFILRHMEMAESVKCTIVCSPAFRNSNDNDVLEAAMLERFRQWLPFIERTVVHDPNQVFMGGTSGGAWRAYHYSAQITRPWAGIFANGGWLGGDKYYGLPYPANLRVAVVNGNNDVPSNYWVESDSKLLTQHGDIVSVMSFEGAHQIAPPSVQIKAAEWLLKRRE